MPSTKKSKPQVRSRSRQGRGRKPSAHVAFYPLLVLTLVLWFLYRYLFSFPVWFDESIGKAVFFGLPVWLYLASTGSREILDSFAFYKIKRGLLLGLAIGGVFGFTSAVLSLLVQKTTVLPAPLFLADAFWWEFFLSLLTAFWESLFFFSWIMVALLEKHPKWEMWRHIAAVVIIFLLFHLPNTALRFSGSAVMVQLFLLTLFALGQALLFIRERNVYTIVMTHSLWGMVLLLHW